MTVKRMCQRNDTEANWLLYNPIILKGEIAFSTDVYNMKIGDGVSRWKDLEYYMVPLDQEEIELLCK